MIAPMARRKRRKSKPTRQPKLPAAPPKPTRAEKQIAQQANADGPAPESPSQEPSASGPPPGIGAGRPALRDIWAWTGFALVAMFFLVMKSYSFHWQIGDENIYMYMAWATAEHGALPYRDYFFAHPPLHLLPGVPLFGLFGIGPLTARILPVGASLVSALFLFLLSRRQVGRLAAVLCTFALLSAFSLLRASSHWTGINLAVMWICIGLYCLFSRKPATAGVMFALGVCTGNYVLPAALMAGLMAVLHDRRSGLRYLVGFLAPWATIQLVGLIVGGAGYIDGVYRYHFLKTSKAGVSREMFYRVSTDNYLIHLGALLAPFMAWLDRRLAAVSGMHVRPPAKPSASGDSLFGLAWDWLRRTLWLDGARGLARVGCLWAVGYLLFIAIIPRVFPFYFLLMFPGLALATAFVLDRMVRHGLGLARGFSRRDGAWMRASGWVLATIVFLVFAYLVRVPIQRGLLPTYVRNQAKPMQYAQSPLPVDGLLRACCWEDTAEARVAYGTVTEVLFHESRYFEKAQELSGWVEQHSEPGDRLFGDASTAGLVALLSSRRLAADFADTNTLRFSTGVSPPREVIEKIDTPALKFVIAQGQVSRDRQGRLQRRYGKFASLPVFRHWLDTRFTLAHQVRDRTKGTFLVLERKR